MTSNLSGYLPQDRRIALALGQTLPDRTNGAALFADISGFTPLTEALTDTFGPRRGTEALTRQLNRVYGTLISEVERYGGSAISFAGDAMLAWFDEQDGNPSARAVSCALELQRAMSQYAAVAMPNSTAVALTLKVAVASGPARRFVVGDPNIQWIDTLAGVTITHTAVAEQLTRPGEVLVDSTTVEALGGDLQIIEWRTAAETGESFAVVKTASIQLLPLLSPQSLDPSSQITPEQLRPWLLPAVFERERSGQGAFLTELRPAVALFLRFIGIDYERDESGEQLDTFISQAQGILTRYEGVLLELTIGDKGSYLNASFGAPIAHEDDALRAAQAAWELSRLPRELSFLEPLQIGISKGTMRTGAYGGPTRLTYGAMGDDTNLAARLMTTAAPGEILVSSQVHKLITDSFNFEPRPPLTMKGKAEPLPVFSITSLRRQRPVRLEESPYTMPMMGRKAELDIIRQKLDLALHGQGQVIGIIGEAGLGKSRLVAEAIRLAHRSGFTGYGGACEASGKSTAYLVWRPIWQAFFNIDLAASPRRQNRNLEIEIEDRIPSRIQAIPVLSPLLDISIEENEFTSTLEPKDRRNVLTALLEDCLKSAGREEPHLLVLEDIHWIDPLSHDLLEILARVCINLPVCILVTYRPPETKSLRKIGVEALAHFTRLELGPLDVAESEQLIRSKLVQLYPEQKTNLSKSLVTMITSRAEGIPFYIEELLNYLRDRGLNPYEIKNLQSIDLPSSLHSLILSRIDQLTEAQKITLKVASIIGRFFLVSWLYGVYPSLGQEAEVRTNLAELAQIDLTILDTPDPDLAYFFKHVLTRDVVYESLAYDTRILLHEQLAQFIETLGEDRFLDLIAYHYGLSENIDKQKEYFQKAGDAAKRAYANEVALEYYERLEHLLTEPDSRIRLHFNRGEIFTLIGRWTEAETEYHSALEFSKQAGTMGNTIRAQWALGVMLRMKGDFPNALAWLELARAGAREAGDWQVEAQALREIGKVNERIGNTASAQEHYRASLKLAQENQNLKMEIEALAALGNVHTEMGDYAIAQEVMEDVLRRINVMGDKEGICAAFNHLGLIAMYQGDKTTAKEYFEKSLTISREIGDKLSASMTLNNLASIAPIYAEAKTYYDESLTISREMGDKRGEGLLHINLGWLATSQADYTSALSNFEEGLRLLREIGDKPGCAAALLNMGYIAFEQGEFTRARSLIQESLVIFREIDKKWGIVYSLVGLAAIAAERKEFQSALMLASAADAIRNSINLALEDDGARLHEHAISMTRNALSETDFEAAWETGSQLTVEGAISLAL